MKAILTCGCSASGKSTLAKELVAQGWVDVNRDDIRFEGYCGGVRDWSLYKFTKERENEVTLVQEHMVARAELLNLNVIISDTNLNDKTRNFWINRLESLGYEVEIKYFDVDLMELLARDAKRVNGVGYKVITDQYAKYMKLRHGHEYHTHVAGLKHCILVDLDGTLAQMQGRSPFDWHRVGEDSPRTHVIGMVEGYFWDTPYPVEVVFMSGRDAICQQATRQWLIDNVGDWTAGSLLLMRSEGDCRKDTIIKKELFDTYIKGHYNVDYVIDDRPCVVRMWRYELGLETVCVSNPFVEF